MIKGEPFRHRDDGKQSSCCKDNWAYFDLFGQNSWNAGPYYQVIGERRICSECGRGQFLEYYDGDHEGGINAAVYIDVTWRA